MCIRDSVFSFVGYQTVEVKPDFENTMTVKMIPAAVGLNKVVVIGYANPNGPPLPPPPTKIKIDSIDSKNPPLYVVDGVITDRRRASYFLEVGVESVSVLKGKQATDKYGEKGKNGVVLLTSKKNANSIPPSVETENKSFDDTNPPLFIMDGVIVDRTKINPDDIASMEVLKLSLIHI